MADDDKLTPEEEAAKEAAEDVLREWNDAMRQQARRLYGPASDLPRNDESLLDWMRRTGKVR